MVFIKRNYELALPAREELIPVSMAYSDFITQKLQEFIQELARGEMKVPPAWLEKGYPPSEYIWDGQLIGLPQEDKKYLHIHIEMLERHQLR